MNDIDRVVYQNWTDPDGNPTGGTASGTGLSLTWQDGPLGRGPNKQEPNGAFVETVVDVCKKRLEFYQTASNGKFACRENAVAITKLDEALMWLQRRTENREKRAVEGTHEV